MTHPDDDPTYLGRLAMESLAGAIDVARAPAATPHILDRIARRWGEAQALVLRHSRTRRRLLLRLATNAPTTFLQRPDARAIIDGELPVGLARALLLVSAPPAWLFDALATHARPNIRVLAAKSTNAPEAILAFSHDPQGSVREAVVLRVPTTELLRLAKDEALVVRKAVAQREDLPADVQELLSKDDDEWVRGGVGRHTREPALLRMLGQDPSSFVRMFVSENEHAPSDVLLLLAQEKEATTRQRVAKNPAATVEVLEALLAFPSDDRSWVDVYDAVLSHPNVTEAIVERIARSPQTHDRKRAARLATGKVARLLATDPDKDVRWSVAYWATELEIHELLARDTDAMVRARIAERTTSPALLLHFVDDPMPWAREAVAMSKHAPLEVLERLARDRDPDVRARVAWNERTSPALLEQLVMDANEDVAHCALRNDALPLRSVVSALGGERNELAAIVLKSRLGKPTATDEDFALALRRAPIHAATIIAMVPRAPAAVLDYIEQSGHAAARTALARTTTDRARLVRQARDGEPSVRAAVARHTDVDVTEVHRSLARDADVSVREAVACATKEADLLELLATDDSEWVRRYVAWGVRTPDAVLARLATDPIEGVRRAALGNPRTPLDTLLRTLAKGGADAQTAKSTLRALGHPKGT